MRIKIIALALGLALPSLAFAQNAEVNQRLENQSDRIDNGLAHGSLNTNQAQRLQNHDARIAGQEQRMAARDPNGQLTRHQDRVLNHRLNHNSHRIHRVKHS